MWIADKYIDYVKEKTVASPGESWDSMLLGFQGEQASDKDFFPRRGFPEDTRSWRL